nr:ATP-binding protein [Acidovorax sp. CF316]
MALGMGGAQAQPQPVVHFTAAQELELPGPPAPLQEHTDWQALGADWREVALPFVFERQIIPVGGTPRVSTRWFRVQVPDIAPPGGTAHFYLKRWQTAGQIAVYADGRLIHRSLGSPSWNLFRHPGLLLPLNQTPLAAPPREILVRMDSLRGAGGGLSSFYVGDTGALLSHYTVREWLEFQLPFMSSSAFLAVALFCFGVWLWRRHDSLYLLLAGFSLLQVVRRWHFHTGLERLPVSDAWFGWITLNALAWQIVILHAFLQLLHGRTLPRLTGALLALTAVFTLLTLPLGLPLPALVLLRPGLQMLQISLAVAVVAGGLWHSWRSRSMDGLLLSSSVAVAVGLGIYDWFKAQQLLDLEWFYLTPYAAVLYLAVFMFIMLRRYVRAITEVKRVNAGLAERLAAREAELERSYQALRTAEHAQTLSQERQRLMQDMHDGLGSSLTSAIRSVQGGTLTDEQMARVLADCMDDLKLAIDSMEPVDADLLLLLATLRFRMGPRIESAGIALRWEVQDVPVLEWLDPSSALHILRIVQETVANILHHTRATQIRFSTDQVGEVVEVAVEDNGQGFDVDKAHAESAGRGLRNLQRRAQAIGGTVAWASGPAGTRFTLWLPIKLPKASPYGLPEGRLPADSPPY